MKSKIVKLPKTIDPRDPLNVNRRLYDQISKLLDQLDERDSRELVTMRERIAALVAIGRIQIIFASLRKEKGHDNASGSSVRKYSAAFTANADARGKEPPGSADDGDDGISAIIGGDSDGDGDTA
jgi:hypothetical protein